MSLTYGNLRDKVLGWLDEDSDSPVLTNVEEALAEANAARASQHAWRFMLASSTITLTPGTTSYSLAANFDRPVYFYNRTQERPMRMTPITRKDVYAAQWLDGNTNDGERFELQGQTLLLHYAPATADVIEYQYYKQPTEPTWSGTEYPDIPFPYSRILIYDALLQLGAYSEDLNPDKVALWTKKQMELETALYAAQLDGDALAAEREFVNQTDNDGYY